MSSPTGQKLFEILRHDPRGPVPLAAAAAVARGVFLSHDTTDPTKVAAATGFWVGVTEVDVIDGPRPLIDVVQPTGLEQPIVKRDANGRGGMVSLVRPIEFEAESDVHLVISGTGALASDTALGSSLSVYAGRLRVAQTDDPVSFRLIDKPNPVASGNLRIRAVAVV